MKKLAQKQISTKIEELRPFSKRVRGVDSWISYLRQGLGMTLVQLAQKMNTSKSALNQVEKNERLGKVTLSSLQKAADALNADLVYAIIPRQSLGDMRQEQAVRKAKKILAESQLHMELENQELQDEKLLQDQLNELIEEIKTSKNLWDDQ